jgi:MOSC domain-containing protein YiiM
MTLLAVYSGVVRTCRASGTGEWWDKEWDTGFHKQPISGEIPVDLDGVEGDEQADLVNHGGPDKAICVYPAAHYPGWRLTLQLPDMPLGAFGENFTMDGSDESEVCIGDVFEAGRLVVQISQPRQPCWKLSRRWKVKDLSAQVVANGQTGWYFRVLEPGSVTPGAVFSLRERINPRWTVAAANLVMHHRKDGAQGASELAECPGLSASWRESLQGRIRSAS